MCMNLAVSWGGYAVLASDHRHSVAAPDGATRRHDYGGKLARIGSGLVAVGGKTAFATVAIERLLAEGVDAADFEAVSMCMRDSADAMVAEVVTRWPHADPTPPLEDQGLLFLAAPDGEVASIVWGGGINLRGRDAAVFQYPPGFPKAEWDARSDAFMSKWSQADTLGGIVRLVASEFAFMATRCNAMSKTLDVAWRDSYLTGPAYELASISDDTIEKYQRQPPAARVDVLSRTLLEYAQ